MSFEVASAINESIGLSPDAINDVFFLLHGPESERHLLMVFGYFDESFDKKAPDVNTRAVCGLIGEKRSWETFNARWWSTLRDPKWPSKPRSFHATECAAGDGQFAGWTYTYRLALIGALMEVIKTSDLLACGVTILPYSFLALPGFVQREFGAPDLLMMQHAIQTTITQASHRYPGSEVGMVFNQDDTLLAAKATWLYQQYKADQKWAKWTGIALKAATGLSMLQAADLMAFGSFRYHQERWYSEWTPDLAMTPIMERMVADMPSTGQSWNTNDLMKLGLSKRVPTPETEAVVEMYIKGDVPLLQRLDSKGRAI
jgi:hypothetical protein